VSNLSKVAEDVKGLAKKFQSILELAAALDGIGSIEQATRDAESAKMKAYNEMELAKFSLSDAKKDLAKAEEAIKAADAKAYDIASKANEKAAEILAEAVSVSNKKIQEGDKKKLVLDAQFNDACKELASLQAEIAGKKNELEDVKAQINSIKSKLQAFVGS